MPIVHYIITLEEPVLFTALLGEPNSAVSYDYVPGSVVRGMLIGAVMRQGVTIDPVESDMCRRFFSPRTRYLNAYAQNIQSQQRSLPAPFSWAREKHPATKDIERIVYDTALSPVEVQTKSVRGFVTVEGTEAHHIQIEHTINVHTQRPRRGGGEGTVYRYDALARGQMFVGAIVCEQEGDANYLCDLLEAMQTVLLGGARSAGYGRVSITGVKVDITNSALPTISNSNSIILTFLSDVIVRGSYGQIAPTLSALLTALNSYGAVLTENAIDVNRVFLDTTMVGGFNRKWGLPLPQTSALAMGSVIVFKAGVKIPEQSIAAWRHSGIGERREDGFGEIAVNWQGQQHYILKETSAVPSVVSPSLLEGNAAELWNRIQTHRAEHVSGSLTDVFTDKEYRIKGEIPRTQLARLRHVIADELRKPEPSRVVISTFLKDIKGKYADRQYSEAQIHGQSLKDWLMEQVSKSPSTDIALLKLLDAVLERAQKEKKRSVPR